MAKVKQLYTELQEAGLTEEQIEKIPFSLVEMFEVVEEIKKIDVDVPDGALSRVLEIVYQVKLWQDRLK